MYSHHVYFQYNIYIHKYIYIYIYIHIAIINSNCCIHNTVCEYFTQTLPNLFPLYPRYVPIVYNPQVNGGWHYIPITSTTWTWFGLVIPIYPHYVCIVSPISPIYKNTFPEEYMVAPRQMPGGKYSKNIAVKPPTCHLCGKDLPAIGWSKHDIKKTHPLVL